MKKLFSFLTSFLLSLCCFAQTKPVIDSFAIDHWTRIGQEIAISGDGAWVMYNVKNMPFKHSTLIVRAVKKNMKWELVDVETGFFSADSKLFVYREGDSLHFIHLKDGSMSALAGIEQMDRGATFEWMSYHLKSNPARWIVRNLITGREHSMDGIKAVSFTPNGDRLLVERLDKGLDLISLADWSVKRIWQGDSLSRLAGHIWNEREDKLALVVQKEGLNEIWVYDKGEPAAVLRVDASVLAAPPGWTITDDLPGFSGSSLIFKVQEPAAPKPPKDFVSLDVWSYTDTVIQPVQLYELKQGPHKLDYAYCPASKKVTKLTNEWEQIRAKSDRSDYVVVCRDTRGDRIWVRNNLTYYLISLATGERKELLLSGGGYFRFSPKGDYLVYTDGYSSSKYNSLELASGTYQKLSLTIPAKNFFDPYSIGYDSVQLGEVGPWGPWRDDRRLIIYDYYDVWELDVTGKTPAVELTKGYGRKNKIKFRIMNSRENILTAYNDSSKYNGFYKVDPKGEKDPEQLSMDACTYYHCDDCDINAINFGIPPVRARSKEVYILLKQSDQYAPNLQVTYDLRRFRPLSDFAPQRAYNWLQSELVNFTLPDGSASQGVLYKPEDFDSSKRYPVLINYYTQMTCRRFEFPEPLLINSSIEIAWFVSRGYLVFNPDIYYHAGHIGESALNTMLGAYKWLSGQRYVDSSKVGINGHSFGGYETNYIVTHTDKFAAAIEGAGTSDMLSSSLILGNFLSQGSRLPGYEEQFGINLASGLDLFLSNSPILGIGEVRTPLLILHNSGDAAVPFSQGAEMFIALRRLNKPVWLLQYDNENHTLRFRKDEIDFGIRMTQFFDHYLKGRPAPAWMVSGVNARKKGLDSGLEEGR